MMNFCPFYVTKWLFMPLKLQKFLNSGEGFISCLDLSFSYHSLVSPLFSSPACLHIFSQSQAQDALHPYKFQLIGPAAVLKFTIATTIQSPSNRIFIIFLPPTTNLETPLFHNKHFVTELKH